LRLKVGNVFDDVRPIGIVRRYHWNPMPVCQFGNAAEPDIFLGIILMSDHPFNIDPGLQQALYAGNANVVVGKNNGRGLHQDLSLLALSSTALIR